MTFGLDILLRSTYYTRDVSSFHMSCYADGSRGGVLYWFHHYPEVCPKFGWKWVLLHLRWELTANRHMGMLSK